MEFIINPNHPVFKKCSEGNFPVYFTPQYQNLLMLENAKLVLVFCPTTEIVLPVKLWKSKFLKLFTCLYQPLKNGEPASIDDERNFLEDFVRECKTKKIAHRITAPYNTAVFQAAPSSSISAGFGTFKLKLSPHTYEQVLASFQARYRTAIRQAQANGIIIKYGKEVISDFYDMHQQTMQRSNMHVQPLKYFTNYLDIMPNNTLLSVAYDKGLAVGGLLLTYTSHSCQYLYGCSSQHTSSSGAIKYLHADAMKRMIVMNVLEYDLLELDYLTFQVLSYKEYKNLKVDLEQHYIKV